jgi:hypothetical protein
MASKAVWCDGDADQAAMDMERAGLWPKGSRRELQRREPAVGEVVRRKIGCSLNVERGEPSMRKIIETLLLRNLQEVFGEADPTRRRAAIAELYAEECVVLLPVGHYVGHDALDRVASELRAGHPKFVYVPHRAPQVVQNVGRITWGSGPPGEPPDYTGLDVIVVRDEKISALYVFLDSPPT